MRSVLSVVLNVVAGFFFYMVSLLGFVHAPTAGAKWGIVLGFTIPAVLAQCSGLALRRFRNWKRNTGIVLLSSSGMTTFVILVFAYLSVTREFQAMAKPETLEFFSDYFSGVTVMVCLAVAGLLLVKADGRAELGATLNAAKRQH